MAFKIKYLIFLQLLALFLAMSSCNSKSEEDETQIAFTASNVAVKNFYIQENSKVLANLESVFFSINLEHGVIFNADSLPKGTDVSRLVPSITFVNTMTKAELLFKKDDNTEYTTVNYLTNPSDSIDFSHDVILKVVGADGLNSFQYTIKINVHKEEPNELVWDELQKSTLPALSANPVAQKTINSNDIFYCLIQEEEGFSQPFTLSTIRDINEGDWQKKPFSPGFIPQVSSFTVTEQAFYILDISGNLYSSEDLNSWTSTDKKWSTILGSYADSVLGIRPGGTGYVHTQYPDRAGYEEMAVGSNFPIKNSSTLGVMETEWADSPLAILVGGEKQDGSISGDVWAYDGSQWAVINSGDLPALETPMLTRYVVYRSTNKTFEEREFDVWLLFGGTVENNEMNREVYFSYDNGVNWSLAPDLMQLTNLLPSLAGADAIVAEYSLSADLSAAWTLTGSTKTRADYTISGYDISWMCPYLYVFGGVGSDSFLNKNIYRGVLARLQFTPSI